MHKVRHQDRKQVTGRVKGKIPDTSFLIAMSSVPEPYLYIYCITTTCLRNVCVSGVPPAGRFFFLLLLLL